MSGDPRETSVASLIAGIPRPPSSPTTVRNGASSPTPNPSSRLPRLSMQKSWSESSQSRSKGIGGSPRPGESSPLFIHDSPVMDSPRLRNRQRTTSSLSLTGMGGSRKYSTVLALSSAALFILFGIAMLSPWNTWITASDYFRYRLKGTQFVDNFESYFSFGFMLTYLLGLIALMFGLQSRISVESRIVSGLLLIMITFSIASGMAYSSSIESNTYFHVTLGLVMLSGICAALLGGFIGVAATLSPTLITCITVGQGIAGVVPAVVQMILSAKHEMAEAGSAKNVLATVIYFSVSVIVAIVALIGFLVVLPAIKRFIASSSGLESSKNVEPVVLDDEIADVLEIEESLEFEMDRTLPTSAADHSTVVDTSTSAILSFKDIWQHAWADSLTIGLTLLITLSLFPAITAGVSPLTPDLSPPAWASLFVPIHFVLFNVGDLIGKSLPLIPIISRLALFDRPLHIFGLIRLLFFPAFLLCHVVLLEKDGSQLPRTLPVLFGDAVFMILVFSMGLTNGLLATLIMMGSPQRLSKIWERERIVYDEPRSNNDPADPTPLLLSPVSRSSEPRQSTAQRLAKRKLLERKQQLLGDLLVFSITLGLFLGGLFSFALRGVLCGCNPFLH